MRNFPKKCGCGVHHGFFDWEELPFVGTQADEVETIELRNCPCGSTIAVVMCSTELNVEDPPAQMRESVERLRELSAERKKLANPFERIAFDNRRVDFPGAGGVPLGLLLMAAGLR